METISTFQSTVSAFFFYMVLRNYSKTHIRSFLTLWRLCKRPLSKSYCLLVTTLTGLTRISFGRFVHPHTSVRCVGNLAGFLHPSQSAVEKGMTSFIPLNAAGVTLGLAKCQWSFKK